MSSDQHAERSSRAREDRVDAGARLRTRGHEVDALEVDTPAGDRLKADATDHGGAVSGPATTSSSAQDEPATRALLGRLNRRGFRLVMLADGLVLAAIIFGTMFVRYRTQWPTYPVSAYLVSFSFALVLFMSSLYFGGLYEREPRLGAPSVLPRAARQTLAAGGMVALLILGATGIAREIGLTAARPLPFPITNLVVLIVLGAVGIAGNRLIAQRLRTRREGPPKVVLAGEAADLAVARGHLAADGRRAEVVEERDDPHGLSDAVRGTGATDVMVVTSGWIEDLYPDQVEALEGDGVTVLLRVSGRETLYGLQRIREVGGLPFVLLRTQTMPRSRARFKRFVDLVALAILAVPGLLLLGAVALYQLIVAGRPLLYRQERVGARGRTFRMIKFRTMAVDAEADGAGARLAAVVDPRIVPGCAWIRASRLDELPQLINVLRGEMSLVGPRPERPELIADFEARIPGYARRHELPPGLTGLAQIHGRYHTDPEYKLGYDLQYLVNWSPVLDLEILLRTVWVVLARRI